MSRQFKGWLGLTLGLLLTRLAVVQVPVVEAPLPALLGPLCMLAAGLVWQFWGLWNMICHLCGWWKELR